MGHWCCCGWIKSNWWTVSIVFSVIVPWFTLPHGSTIHILGSMFNVYTYIWQCMQIYNIEDWEHNNTYRINDKKSRWILSIVVCPCCIRTSNDGVHPSLYTLPMCTSHIDIYILSSNYKHFQCLVVYILGDIYVCCHICIAFGVHWYMCVNTYI